MLGFSISVYRLVDLDQPDALLDALTSGDAELVRARLWSPPLFARGFPKAVADWDSGWDVLVWLKHIAEAGPARMLSGDGYPYHVVARARDLVPDIRAGVPGAGPAYELADDGVVTVAQFGAGPTDCTALEACDPEEWLVLVVFDLS